jgi:hypothetical protein
VSPAADPLGRDVGGDAYAELTAAVRGLQDGLHAAVLPDDRAAAMAAVLRELTAAARAYTVPEEKEIVYRRPDLPGRGCVMLPGFIMRQAGPHTDVGYGRFSVAFRGLRAVHGGAIALLFDEALGRLAERVSPGSRTAYLRVDFLKLTPVGQGLRIQATIDKIDGRKAYLSGQLSRGHDSVATAHGLWVVPRLEPVSSLPGSS